MLTNLPSLAIGAADLAAAFLFMYGLKRMWRCCMDQPIGRNDPNPSELI